MPYKRRFIAGKIIYIYKWVIWHCHILPKGNRQNCGFSATNMTFNALVLSGQSTGMSLPGISGLHLTPQVHWGLNWPKKSGFKWLISIIVAIIYHELPIVGWSNPGIYLPKLGISTSTISTGMNSETEQLIGIHSISIDQRVPNQGVFPINIAILWGYQFSKT